MPQRSHCHRCHTEQVNLRMTFMFCNHILRCLAQCQTFNRNDKLLLRLALMSSIFHLPKAGIAPGKRGTTDRHRDVKHFQQWCIPRPSSQLAQRRAVPLDVAHGSREPSGSVQMGNPSGTATPMLNCWDYKGKVREPSVADREGYLVWR